MSNAVPGRWYAPHEVERGAKLFDRYCSTCHGARESGGLDWDHLTINAKDVVPLDGDGHVWHHSLGELVDTINEGNLKGMPALGRQLDRAEILDTIAFLQSNWSDEVYNAWYSVNHLENAQRQD